MLFTTEQLLAVAASLALALALRKKMVAEPKVDRWHRKPTAMLGGLGVFLTVAVVYAAFVPHTQQGLAVMAASSFLFLVGLVDDLLHIKPYQKLIGQMMGAAMLIYFGAATVGVGGLTLPWTSSVPVNMAITIFWLIGITNAVNLLDNMDGLAAGIAAIASAFLAANFVGNG